MVEIGDVMVQSGRVVLSKKDRPVLMTGKGDRGIINGYVKFDCAFSSPPEVTMGISTVDLIHGNNHRLHVEVKKVDTNGFRYDFKTWADTRVWVARAYWTAIGAK